MGTKLLKVCVVLEEARRGPLLCNVEASLVPLVITIPPSTGIAGITWGLDCILSNGMVSWIGSIRGLPCNAHCVFECRWFSVLHCCEMLPPDFRFTQWANRHFLWWSTTVSTVKIVPRSGCCDLIHSLRLDSHYFWFCQGLLCQNSRQSRKRKHHVQLGEGSHLKKVLRPVEHKVNSLVKRVQSLGNWWLHGNFG